MEDRKRGAPVEAPDEMSSKRQAMTSDVSTVTHVSPQSQDDVLLFQKEAIFRQMQAYKRERDILQQRLDSEIKRNHHHAERILVIDQWWDEMLEELGRLDGLSAAHEFMDLNIEIGQSLEDTCRERITNSLLFADSKIFSSHLQSRRDTIVKRLKSFLSLAHTHSSRINVESRLQDLENKLRIKSKSEKELRVQVDGLVESRNDLDRSLMDATLKYLAAEKKIDRMKSATLAKANGLASTLVATNLPGHTDEATSVIEMSRSPNADLEASMHEIKSAYKEAQAITLVQADELDRLRSANNKLSDEISSLSAKLGLLGGDEVSGSDIYKSLKTQFDDLVKRFNHLQAVNGSLREEITSLLDDRNAFEETILAEQQTILAENNNQLIKSEQDVARIRAARDDILNDLNLRRSKDSERLQLDKELEELAQFREQRIAILESEIAQLKLRQEETAHDNDDDFKNIDSENFRDHYVKLAKENRELKSEVSTMMPIFKRALDVSKGHVSNLISYDERITKLQLEKSKAEQKYFAAMKAIDSYKAQIPHLSKQNEKSAGIIAQLKESEKALKSRIANLDRQTAEYRGIESKLTDLTQDLHRKVSDANSSLTIMKRQAEESSQVLKAREIKCQEMETILAKVKQELAGKISRLEAVDKEIIRLRKSKKGDEEAEEIEQMRYMLRCNNCKDRFRDSALRACGHVFCRPCLEERLQTRARKCPACGRAFDKADVLPIYLTG